MNAGTRPRTPPSPPPPTSPSPPRPDRSDFERWSDSLYCSGTEELRCAASALGESAVPGQCFWFMPGPNGSLAPVRAREMSDKALALQKFAAQWRPELAGAPGFRQFRRDDAVACLRGRRVLLLGDSQTRDTFLQLTTAVGSSLHWWAQPGAPGRLTAAANTWRDNEWAPRTREASMGRDGLDKCLGSDSGYHTCVRDVSFAPRFCVRYNKALTNTTSAKSNLAAAAAASATSNLAAAAAAAAGATEWRSVCARDGGSAGGPARLGFFFLNGRWRGGGDGGEEMRALLVNQLLRRKGQPPFDTLLVQCPVRGALQPHAYDYSRNRSARHEALPEDEGIAAVAALGRACEELIELVRRHTAGRLAVYVLGYAGRDHTSATATAPAEARLQQHRRLVDALHAPLGLRCARTPDSPAAAAAAARSAAGRPAAARYSLESRHGYVPIDRLNTWGRRTADGRHPYFTAQTATVQLLLNHMCPAAARPGVCLKR